MAMLTMEGDKFKELTVADPSRKLSRILPTIPNCYKIKREGIDCFPDKKSNTTMFIVDLPKVDYLGKSVTIKL